MKKRPLFLPFTILITTILLGISVPAIMLANRSNEGGFSHPGTTPTPAVSAFARDGQYRDIVEQNLKNCTYHGYHWETVPEAWPSQITLGGVTYTRADMLKLRNAPEGDPAIDLIKEVQIAIVNIYNGASQSRVEATLVEADRWLTNHQADGELSQFNQQQARSFTSVLADYNHGRLFPVACADQIPVPTVEVAQLETTLPTDPTSTEPSVAADQPAAARNIQSNSTANTGAPPSSPTPSPTDEPVPTPTETLAPPPPTHTPLPPPTNTPIPPPAQPAIPAPPVNPPPVDPPGNPDKDNQGQGNQDKDKSNQGQGNQDKDKGNQGQGNRGQGNQGQGNPGQGNQGQSNQGQGNQGQGNQGQGNQDKDKDNQGQGNQDKDKDNQGQGNQDKDKGNQGQGNQDKDKDNQGQGNQDKDKDKGNQGGNKRP
jgi:hypothetical protein